MKRLLIPALLFLGAAPAFAQTDATASTQARHERMEARLDTFGARLGLDADALAGFRATLERYHGQMKPLRADARQARQSLRDELASAQPDAGRVTQLTERLERDRQQMQSLRAQQMAELKRELTPQQYAKLLLRRPHMGRHMHGRDRAAQ